ncbi:glycosyltransferase [Sinomonas atrocyanea]|uniref:glycosyltransferase n=1 Tax=Sinomonas atrocyanea TaxID=37927 RepID=UPI003D995F93
MARRPRLLLVAYACDPEEGSESGAGWSILEAAANICQRITVLTRTGTAPLLEERASRLPCEVEIVRVSTPRLTSKGNYIRYIGWLSAVHRLIREVNFRVDIFHHATFASDWLPIPLPRGYSARYWVVWGPVGGSTYLDTSASTFLSASAALKSHVRRVCTSFVRCLTRIHWAHKVDVFMAMNSDSLEAAPAGARSMVHPNFAMDYAAVPTKESQSSGGPKRLIYVGRVLEWKGLGLLIRALAQIPGHTLVVVGDGPDRGRFERLATRLGVADRISFRGRVERNAVLDELRQSDIMAFPSLHDSGGWVAAEAAAVGLPVLCLDQGGVAALAGPNAVVVPLRPARTLVSRLGVAAVNIEPSDFGPNRRWTIERLTDALASAYTPEGAPRRF